MKAQTSDKFWWTHGNRFNYQVNVIHLLGVCVFQSKMETRLCDAIVCMKREGKVDEIVTNVTDKILGKTFEAIQLERVSFFIDRAASAEAGRTGEGKKACTNERERQELYARTNIRIFFGGKELGHSFVFSGAATSLLFVGTFVIWK